MEALRGNDSVTQTRRNIKQLFLEDDDCAEVEVDVSRAVQDLTDDLEGQVYDEADKRDDHDPDGRVICSETSASDEHLFQRRMQPSNADQDE